MSNIKLNRIRIDLSLGILIFVLAKYSFFKDYSYLKSVLLIIPLTLIIYTVVAIPFYLLSKPDINFFSYVFKSHSNLKKENRFSLILKGILWGALSGLFAKLFSNFILEFLFTMFLSQHQL
jgi:uncharacterized membrane protein